MKARVKDIQFNPEFFRPFTKYMVLPSESIGDASQCIDSPESLSRWQARFTKHWGNIVLHFTGPYWGYKARYCSKFKRWQKDYISAKARALSSWGKYD